MVYPSVMSEHGATDFQGEIDYYPIFLSPGVTYEAGVAPRDYSSANAPAPIVFVTDGAISETTPYGNIYGISLDENPYVSIFGSDENVTAPYTVPAAGTYYLGVFDYGLGTGNYVVDNQVFIS